ncbi:hypothetical protein CJF30_00007169 [Rutstroemia sp. NJR-2017a BBW]|nr:hypothetical protein CJF30_00007169 [Rutstroemia sp. NJR-2017a BBW]
MFKGNEKGAVFSGLASGVPGDLRGLEYLHKKYGALPWRAVCNPAVHVARNGFPVTEDTAYYMKNAMLWSGSNFLTDDPNWAVDFAPNGTLLGVGDIMTRNRLASTLETIAAKGVNAFYDGEIANATINAIQSTNGTMTLQDLKDYKVEIRNPLNITYRGYTLHSCGTPSGGSIALSILKLIEGYNMSEPSLLDLDTHRLDEAMRFSYAAHAELGDPLIYPDIEAFEQSMISEENAKAIRGKILDNRTQNVTAYQPKMWAPQDNHGTSHIVASDSSGLSISSTSTVNLLFGSMVMVPETGVIMNNEMDDFSIPGTPNSFGFVPSPMNYINPHARPMSSISPIIITHPNGSLYLSVGAAGGSRIPTSTIQTIINVIDHGMTLEEALKQPRMHDQLLPERTTVEPGFSEDLVRGLVKRGHLVVASSGRESAVQGVRVWGGSGEGEESWFEAVGEPRQKGSGGISV